MLELDHFLKGILEAECDLKKGLYAMEVRGGDTDTDP